MKLILENIHIAMPEMIILFSASMALLGDLFFKNIWKNIALVISCIGLFTSMIFTYVFIGSNDISSFNGLYIASDSTHLMKLFIEITVLLSFLYSHYYINERKIPTGEYYVLGLFSSLGMMILVSANSMLTIYLGLELLSLPVYAMTAIRRTDSDSAEAAMKYFIMGAIASAMLLYGISLVYASTGHLSLTEIAQVISQTWPQNSSLLTFALVFILTGLGFKLAAVPFHMWTPDVYQGAPSSVTLFISTAPKIAAIGMVFRILTVSLVDLMIQWQQILLVMSLLSVGLGNLLAISQTNIKRLLAYSAISHIGYALFGILAGTAAGYSASLYYILIYSLMSSAAFGLVVLMSSNGVEIESITDLKGLNKQKPWLAFMMLIVMFSMAGVPPTVGFFTKLLVLKALVDVQMTWVAVLGLLFAVIGAFYYIRIIKTMYFEDPDSDRDIVINIKSQWLYSINCLSLLYFGIFPAGLITLCVRAFS